MTRRLYVGVDPGLAWCGLAALDDAEELVLVGVFASKKDRHATGDTQRRLTELERWIAHRLDAVAEHGAIVAAAVEWPLAAGRHAGARRATSAHSAHQVAAAAGAAHAICSARWPTASPIPQQWRRAYAGTRTGYGVAPRRIEDRYGVASIVGKTRAPHACDAIGLAAYARRHGTPAR